MPLPAILAAQMARFGIGRVVAPIFRRAIPAATFGSIGFGLAGGGGGGGGVGGRPRRRRRRRARLTQSEMMELQQIKNILGRTAAANALPYYMGRGR